MVRDTPRRASRRTCSTVSRMRLAQSPMLSHRQIDAIAGRKHLPIQSVGNEQVLRNRRYRLVRLIGQGAFGEVWEAIDTHRSHEPTLESHTVALKLITTRDRGATWHEASILTALKSDHILEVNNADIFVDVPYIDTVLAATSLDKQAFPVRVEPERATAWKRRALRGLELCHQHRLLHRDVKPATFS